MISKETIEEIIRAYLLEKELELVEIKTNKANNIKVFVDAVGRNTTMEDCVKLSKFIENNLDREVEDFSLMVSSAGK